MIFTLNYSLHNIMLVNKYNYFELNSNHTKSVKAKADRTFLNIIAVSI